MRAASDSTGGSDKALEQVEPTRPRTAIFVVLMDREGKMMNEYI